MHVPFRHGAAVLLCTSLLFGAACSDDDAGDAATEITSVTTTVPADSATTTPPTSGTPIASVESTTTTAATAATRPTAEVECGPVVYEFPDDLYPFEDHCLDLGHGDYHYVDERPASEPIGTVLMVHGNPESSFIYRNIAQDLLARGYRVIAPDHYGFGESAKPAAADFSYRPSEHSAVLGEFVEALDLQDVTLVVQDWGGPIGLGMAVQRPDRIRNILVMNTMAWQVTDEDANGPFAEVVKWSQLNRDNADQIIAEGQVVSGAANLLAAPYDEPLASEVRGAYLGPFFDPSTGRPWSETVNEPPNRLARSILEDTDMFDTLGELQPLVDKPVSFFFGAQDTLFGALIPSADGTCALGAPAEQGGRTVCVDADGAAVMPALDRFVSLWNADAITSIEIDPDADHFVQEDAPERVAELVAELNA